MSQPLSSSPLRIAIVAGEMSGDILGAGLIQAIQKIHPTAQFEGIGGPKMLELGFQSLFEMDRLSVMGLIEPLKRLPELLNIRKTLREKYIANPPDVFIGIDSPDFNLDLELSLKKSGIKTCHYVSPSVWAWRQGRIKKIKKAVDLMLTLLPFEADFYQKHQVPVEFIGHPLADELPVEVDQDQARKHFGFSKEDKLVTLMPGSRGGEVARLGLLYLQVAQSCLVQQPELKFILPAANQARREQIEAIIAQSEAFGQLPLTVVDGDSHNAMAAADAVLMASGTTALEALLLKKPMVVAYKMAPLSYYLFGYLVKVPYMALPNLLSNHTERVPEFTRVVPNVENLTQALLSQLSDDENRQALVTDFTKIHKSLKRDASAAAAKAVLTLIGTH